MILLLTGFTLLNGCQFLNEEPTEMGGVDRVTITLTDSGLESLYESVFYGDRVPCYAQTNDERAVEAEIKVRGDMTRLVSKKSYNLYMGDVIYALDASYFDPSVLRNRLCFDAYRDLGVPAPETEGIALFINDDYAGYYTMIERYSEEGLKDFYSAQSVEMYKCWFVNMGYDDPLQCQSEKKIPLDDDDFDSFNRLLINLMNLNDDDWIDYVNAHFDIEATARYLAVHNFQAVVDTTYKNYNIALIDGKYLILPWDNEGSLSRWPNGDYKDTSDYEFEGDNLLSQRLLMDGSPVKSRYDGLIDDYYLNESETIESETAIDRMVDRYNQYVSEISTAVSWDYMRNGDYGDFLAEDSVINAFYTRRASEMP